MAMAVTQIATAAAGLGWMFVEVDVQGQALGAGHLLRRRRRPGRHHPGLGLRGAGPALVIGFVAGAVCFAATKKAMRGGRSR